MNKTWIDSFILRAFVPRYERQQTQRVGLEEKERAKGRVRRNGLSLFGERWRQGRVSYADMVKGNKGDGNAKTECGEKGGGGKMAMEFQSSTEERGWLHGALTGRLKDDFLWKFHGEEVQNECLGKLKISDMGDRMVLIQSESDRNTEEVIEDFKEWAEYWLDWWRPWRSRDVNQRRLVWTRWTGVPLQAWSRRFFSWGCSKLGRVVEIHGDTDSRRKLDAAYVRIITGLNSIIGTMTCKIDGESFNVRIEEVCCMDKDLLLQRCWETDTNSEFALVEEAGSADSRSVEACLARLSSASRGEDGPARGGSDASNSSHHVTRAADLAASIDEKAAQSIYDHNDVCGTRDFELREEGVPLPIQIGPITGLEGNGPGVNSFGTFNEIISMVEETRDQIGGLDTVPNRGRDFLSLKNAQFLQSSSSSQIQVRNTENGRALGNERGVDRDDNRQNQEREERNEVGADKEGSMGTGVEGWNFGKQLGLLARVGEDRVVRAFEETADGEDKLGVGVDDPK